MQTKLSFLSEDLRVASSDEWLIAFASHLAETGRSERTVRAYVQDLRSFASWFAQANGQEFEPGLITSFDLRAYREYALTEKRVSASTWNRWRAALRVFSEWAKSLGFVASNPAADLRPMEQVELPPRWLTKVEAHRLMRACEVIVNGATTGFWRWQALRDQAILALMLYAGLRQGEVAALDLADVEIGERSGRVRVRMGKGGKRREVPLNREARRSLAAWLENRDHGGPALFPSKRSARISARTIIRQVAEIGRQAGIEGLRPHDLRHTCAKRMADEGVQLTVIQRVLGHERLETTARYLQPGWEDFEKAVETI